MAIPLKVKNSLGCIDKDLSSVLNYIMVTQDDINKNINNMKTLINNMNDGLLQRVILNQEKLSMNQNELSIKLDKIVSAGDYTTKSKSRSKQTKKKPTTVRVNKLTWVKESYDTLGWKFWDPIIENAKEEIEKLLDAPEHKEELKKRTGKAKKQKEAAIIYAEFKNNKDIQTWINSKFNEHKEMLQKNEDATKVAEMDEVSE